MKHSVTHVRVKAESSKRGASIWKRAVANPRKHGDFLIPVKNKRATMKKSAHWSKKLGPRRHLVESPPLPPPLPPISSTQQNQQQALTCISRDSFSCKIKALFSLLPCPHSNLRKRGLSLGSIFRRTTANETGRDVTLSRSWWVQRWRQILLEHSATQRRITTNVSEHAAAQATTELKQI